MALLLTEQDVRELLDPLELISAMETALASFSTGEAIQPVRTVIGLNEGAFFAAMPAYMPALPVHGAKLVSVIPDNLQRGLPSHRATILLVDPATGNLLAVLDGRLITEMRTAAVSALSVRYLARQRSRVLAILGNGVQAHSHRAILPLVRQFEEVRAWSPTSKPANAAPSAKAAVEGADVIVLATSSPVPVIDDAWVKPGAHVISVGACVPTQREMDPALVARSFLVVDSRAAALKESGDVVQGIQEGRFSAAHIKAELGERPARTSDAEVTVFKSLGLAVEDLAAAHLVYRRARETNQGTNLNI